MTAAPSAATRVAAVIGSPIAHSRSPAIHNAAFAATGLDWVYVGFDVATGGGAAAVDAMRTFGLGGLSVTMPLKGEVATAVDRRSPEADALGSVNCVAWDGDALVGHSTDGPGLLDALTAAEVAVAGRRVVVLGAGGAARAVVDSLSRAGAAEVVVVNRTTANAERIVDLAGGVGRLGRLDDIGPGDLVVNATPLGMAGTPGEAKLPLDPARLDSTCAVVDLVYTPQETPLLAAARNAGAQAVDGLGMLVHQAARAFVLWTDHEAPVPVMTAAAAGN
ncbi:MAG: shikimate dehydrogenase [Acidimicrobiia bacterium]|nr:shikimate dehydrogenase [Acidimicrobiia bacterium]